MTSSTKASSCSVLSFSYLLFLQVRGTDMSMTFYLVPQDVLQTLHLFKKLGPQFSDTGNVEIIFLHILLKTGD